MEISRVLRENYPKYLFFSKELDLELQGVKDKDIKKIYTPRDYFKSLFNKSNLSQIEKSSKKLCELFIQEGLPDNSIGITGSSMIGLSKKKYLINLKIAGNIIYKNLNLIMNGEREVLTSHLIILYDANRENYIKECLKVLNSSSDTLKVQKIGKEVFIITNIKIAVELNSRH